LDKDEGFRGWPNDDCEFELPNDDGNPELPFGRFLHLSK